MPRAYHKLASDHHRRMTPPRRRFEELVLGLGRGVTADEIAKLYNMDRRAAGRRLASMWHRGLLYRVERSPRVYVYTRVDEALMINVEEHGCPSVSYRSDEKVYDGGWHKCPQCARCKACARRDDDRMDDSMLTIRGVTM